MKTLMFYSYKGGSGRTVAVANVAAALAKLGKRVGVIDLDFEAPGLHHVFGVENTPQYSNAVGIQQYLLGERELDELNSLATIDMFGEGGPLRGEYVPPGAILIYVMASAKVTNLGVRINEVAPRMRILLKDLAENYQLDVVILDAASGIRTAFEVAINVSDEMLIFFRWSTQHVEGTIKMAKYMRMMKEFQTGRPIPFKLVASAVPSHDELDKQPDHIRDPLQRSNDDARAKISETLQQCQVLPAEVFHEINELLPLKWKERVIVFDEPASDYEALARKLL